MKIVKKGSTLFLKAVLVIMGLAVLAFCIFGLPPITAGIALEFPPTAPLREGMLFGLWLTALPFFFALFQAFKLLNHIDKNIAFSELSATALRKIKYSALTMTGLYLLGMPVALLMAEYDDAPGIVPLAFLLACSPVVIAVFAAVLEKLVRSAIEIKAESELTV
jgi:hypothetical protein